jgi:hypothetical protein
METRLRTDSDGVQHQIVVQELAMSCGPACAWMIESAVKRMSMAGGEARIRRLQCALTGECVSNTTGTTNSAVLAVLKATGVPVRHYAHRSPGQAQKLGALTVDTSRIRVDSPALLNFAWIEINVANKTGKLVSTSGHYMVAARKSRFGKIVLLDPMGGNLWEVENDGIFGTNGLLESVAYTA